MVNYILKQIDPTTKRWYRPFIRSWGITLKALVIVVIILVLRFVIEYFGLAVIPLNALITALLGGVFFTISILFAGAAADFKESEKIPGELVVSLKTMYKDTKIITVAQKDKHIVVNLQKHITELTMTINSNFRRNVWKLREIDASIDVINEDIRQLAEAGVAPGYITKLRSELTTIDKLSNRIDVIEETSFIPAAYTLAYLAISSLVIILLFLKLDLGYFSYLVIGAISAILISLVFLIKDMDNPFEVNTNSYADVDLSNIFNLEEYLKSQTHVEEKEKK